ncbi:small multi-drug export protein [Methanorbis rubei]|uniref:Small multi-drug export protein n=1 Tax=Methanorbis rubei TaxID=3028300 RepID=A0AAE4MFS6_9EURY|nr:hypothetical protein [Methanocorpusculaceae archaeon Cs1]
MAEEGRTTQEWAKIILRRLVFLGGPLALYGAFIVFLWFVYPPEGGLLGQPSERFLIIMGLLIAYLVPPFGKETIIPISMGLGFPAWLISSGIILMDICSCLLIALNFDLLQKIPFVGGLIRKFTDGANKVRKKSPWIEQLSHVGLLIFMYIPLQGSGATNSTILGQLFGMRKITVFWIVTLGSILSTLTIAFGSAAVLDLWQVNPWYAVLAIVLIAVAVIVLAVLWHRYTKRFSPKNPACDCDTDEEDFLP